MKLMGATRIDGKLISRGAETPRAEDAIGPSRFEMTADFALLSKAFELSNIAASFLQQRAPADHDGNRTHDLAQRRHHKHGFARAMA